MRRLVLSLSVMALVAAMAAPATAQEVPPGGTFYDDDGNVHEGAIEAIASRGVTLGCDPDGTIYCVADSVTRDQMASFLARAFDLPEASRDFFPDDEGSVHEDNINRLAAAGITEGFDDGTYGPRLAVTREQMASFLARALDLDPVAGDLFDDVSGVHEGNINALARAGVTEGCDQSGDLFCPRDPVRRDQMASFVARARDWPEINPPEFRLSLQKLPGSFASPLLLTSPSGDDRLFVMEQGGAIRIIDGNQVLADPFLDLSGPVLSGGEQGLLGLAFHPDYADNGLFYVDYTDNSGDSVLYEFQVSSDPDVADADSGRLLLEVDQPYSNHNGGGLAFGPDGYLYWGLGDGGSGGDPHEHGQNTNTLLGSMLRIDVDSGTRYGIPADNPFADGQGGAEEVWSYGLRNPWRWSFDFEERLLYIGDVGQGAWEEVDVVPSGAAGLNFGWNDMEGSHCYEPSSGCATSGRVLPRGRVRPRCRCLRHRRLRRPWRDRSPRGGLPLRRPRRPCVVIPSTGMAGRWVIGSGPTRSGAVPGPSTRSAKTPRGGSTCSREARYTGSSGTETGVGRRQTGNVSRLTRQRGSGSGRVLTSARMEPPPPTAVRGIAGSTSPPPPLGGWAPHRTVTVVIPCYQGSEKLGDHRGGSRPPDLPERAALGGGGRRRV